MVSGTGTTGEAGGPDAGYGDAIAAVATAPGHGAIGVVRASGTGLDELAQRLTGLRPSPRHAHLASFADAQGRPIDSGLMLYFPAPHSFTGEDVLELQGHGSPAVLHRLAQRLCELGCRQARPGEFSLRAHLNGKLSLPQAEAMADLIQARTATAAELAAQALDSGAAHGQIDQLLTQARVQLEAALDFPDEHLDLAGSQAIDALLRQAEELLDEATRRGRLGLSLYQGLQVVLVGAPNVGKSTLLNALCGREAALVSEEAGTTRDAITANAECCGVPVHLTDTAGLRDRAQAQRLEAQGMELGLRRAGDADLLLLLHDGTGPDPAKLLADEAPQLADTPALRLRTKIDLAPDQPVPQGELPVSARTGQGLDQLRTAIAQRGTDATAAREQPLWSNQRHLDSQTRAAQALAQARQSLAQNAPELAAEHLRQAADILGELIAPRSADDLLGEIFSNFCIGK